MGVPETVSHLDFVYKEKVLDNPGATLADIGMTDGDELLVVGSIEEPPLLVSSSSSEE